MRGSLKMLCYAILTLLALAEAAHAQTPFQWLFDPRSALSVILEMPQTAWNQLAAEQPVGGICNFSLSPTIDRYSWHQTNATIVTDGGTNMQVNYQHIGIKKKSYCGSIDNTKPSLTINLTKNNNANQGPADNQLGTVHLSLENSKQDGDLFRQCAGYYVFQAMNIPASMCSFVALYRRDTTSSPKIFLGLYVLTEALKKDFFQRRAPIQNVVNGSLYEFEAPDDFTSATISQLQVDWSSTQDQDFLFAVNKVQQQTGAALADAFDLPAFIRYWATEIFAKHWDGFTNNRNNTYTFDDPPANPQSIVKTQFRFIPHGIDQIFATSSKPTVWTNAAVAQAAFKDNGLRYQLISALVAIGDEIQAANVLDHIDSFVPLVIRNWRGQDFFFGADRNKTVQMAEHVRLAVQQAIVDVRTVFGHGLVAPQTNQTFRLVGPHHIACMTRLLTGNPEVSWVGCANQQGQGWVFDAAPISMANVGFPQPLVLYRLRNQGSSDCVRVTTAFPDGSGRFKLEMAPCNVASIRERFFLIQREGRSFELRSFAENGCAHFSDSVLTTDGRLSIYLGTCDGQSKNLIVAD